MPTIDASTHSSKHSLTAQNPSLDMPHPTTIHNKLGQEEQQQSTPSSPSSPSSVLAFSPNHLPSPANLHPAWRSSFDSQPGLLSSNTSSSNVSTILSLPYHSVPCGSCASLSIPNNSTNERLIKGANENVEKNETENIKLFIAMETVILINVVLNLWAAWKYNAAMT
ncbi:7781_t:CDS:2 [Paraglomus occultum]|uniref:7781_t:CDS:1 n=1 Tax=Paraglomus occultum TaxID=144539 RepID=A0A9N9D2M9_9GLOM|nr:7781_t:CDS:2 [Paraglomus occultum]